MTAAQAWAEQLAQWAIPQEILDAAPESPWGFDVAIFAQRADRARQQLTPSNERALEALPAGGAVLDVGCGGGAAAAPLAGKAARVVGVDSSVDMLESFQQRFQGRGLDTTVVVGRWPEAASMTPTVDVVVCHHVAYNAPDLAEFAVRLTDHASQRVVLELTRIHPMSRLNQLWLHFHGLQRPAGPTADDAVAVLRELGVDPQRLDWDESSTVRMLRFSSQEDVVQWIRRRLCLSASHDDEIWMVAKEHLVEHEGGWSFPPVDLVTLWWPGSARRD